MPFFSIITPTYNRATFLPKAIESVLSQKFLDWELIIVDDGSTDNTKEVVTNYSDSRIRYIYQENAERSAARNNGIRNSKGNYICFLDSDDYYLPQHLMVFNDYIIKNNYPEGLLFTNVILEYNGVNKKIKLQYNNNPFPFLFNNYITPNMVCIHKKSFNTNLFPEQFINAFWEDTHLWIRIALSNPVFYIDNYTCVQLEHSNRSINTTEKHQLETRYNDHLGMVKNLLQNNKEKLLSHLDQTFFNEYLDNRHCMFLYMSRTNKYLFLSLKIWKEAWKNRPSIYLLKEFILMFLNFVNIKK